MPDWTLQPGEQIQRKDLHDRFAGARQGGIEPSRKTPNVFLFADSASGERHGYIDGWQDDGCFHYPGEGQREDQQMTHGNAATLRHVEQRRALRLFEGAGGEITYLGEFAVDTAHPFYTTDAPEPGGGPMRQPVIRRGEAELPEDLEHIA